MKDLKSKKKKSLGNFLHICCPSQNGMSATEFCGEYAVTSMILSYLEILWYGFGCFTVYFFPFYVLNCRFAADCRY